MVKISELQTQLTLAFKQIFIVSDKPLKKAETVLKFSQKKSRGVHKQIACESSRDDETLLKMSLIKSHENSVCDKNHMPTLNNQLRMSALIQEGIFLKDTSMAIPQLDMKKTFFNAYENHL